MNFIQRRFYVLFSGMPKSRTEIQEKRYIRQIKGIDNNGNEAEVSFLEKNNLLFQTSSDPYIVRMNNKKFSI